MLATKPSLTLELAKQLAAAAEHMAAMNGWKMSIAIADDGGNPVYLERMDGALLGSVQVAIDKSRSAVLFQRSTKVFEDAVAGGRSVVMKLTGSVPLEGGLPLVVLSGDHSYVIGGVGASGATAPEDGQVAQAAVDELERVLAGGKR